MPGLRATRETDSLPAFQLMFVCDVTSATTNQVQMQTRIRCYTERYHAYLQCHHQVVVFNQLLMKKQTELANLLHFRICRSLSGPQ